jgi:uncharacterized protein YeaO (DUF488 family)
MVDRALPRRTVCREGAAALLSLRIVRLGSERRAGEGPRIGAVRRPPRGVPKRDYARRNFYDAWLPELSPSQPLVSWALADPWTAGRWNRFARRYRKEMAQPAPQRLIALLAALSRTASFSLGCYCEDEARCHRSLLRALLAAQGAKIAR